MHAAKLANACLKFFELVWGAVLESAMVRIYFKVAVFSIFATTLTFVTLPALAQPFDTIRLDEACSYFGNSIQGSATTFGSIREAEESISSIVRVSGLAQNFRVEAASVDNAAAVIQGSDRFILYNPSFTEDMNSQAGTRWAAISIMAHEVGHHLNGHTLVPGGSRPPTELQADYFSGFVLQKLGASLDESRVAMRIFGNDQATTTHPGKSERLAAIASGWRQACDQDPNCGGSEREPPPEPRTGPPPPRRTNPPPPRLVYTDECMINGESVLITSQNEVISPDRRDVLGYRVRSLWPSNCVFDLTTNSEGRRYCVARSGHVYMGDPNPVGRCSQL